MHSILVDRCDFMAGLAGRTSVFNEPSIFNLERARGPVTVAR